MSVIIRLRSLLTVLILLFPYIAFFLPAQDSEDGVISASNRGVSLLPYDSAADE